MKIYDTSALFAAIAKDQLELDAFVLDLALYEGGNVIRKNLHLRKTITKEEAGDLIQILENWKNVIYIERNRLSAVLATAGECNLSFYDGAYVHAAKRYDAELLTADKAMYQKSKDRIKVNLVDSE